MQLKTGLSEWNKKNCKSVFQTILKTSLKLVKSVVSLEPSKCRSLPVITKAKRGNETFSSAGTEQSVHKSVIVRVR